MIVFVGSGPHNLTTLAFLLKADPSLRSEVVVFDPSGAWLDRWNRQMSRQEIVHLRSSSVHHPDPDPLALRHFAKGRFDEFYPPYYLPGTGLFREFCEDVVRRFDLSGLVRPFGVTELIPSSDGQIGVILSNGEKVMARAVVAALGGGDPVLPAWLAGPPLPDVVHSDEADLNQLESATGHLALVGGGLTSGHLALAALRRGWSVELLTRRPVRYKLFDAAPGWIGPKFMTGFHREQDWKRRRAMIARARGGGAMTEEIREYLAPFLRSKQLILRPWWTPTALEPKGQRWVLRASWGRRVVADKVWFCTGNRLDVTSHSLLGPLFRKYPISVVGGLPVLDEDCRWPGLPLYLMGMPSALRVGPTARNFPGARQVASRIVRSLTGIVVPPT